MGASLLGRGLGVEAAEGSRPGVYRLSAALRMTVKAPPATHPSATSAAMDNQGRRRGRATVDTGSSGAIRRGLRFSVAIGIVAFGMESLRTAASYSRCSRD